MNDTRGRGVHRHVPSPADAYLQLKASGDYKVTAKPFGESCCGPEEGVFIVPS